VQCIMGRLAPSNWPSSPIFGFIVELFSHWNPQSFWGTYMFASQVLTYLRSSGKEELTNGPPNIKDLLWLPHIPSKALMQWV
jgi:hypothetical protein